MGLLSTTRPAILALIRDLERRLGVHRIPSLRLDDFDQLELLRYLQPIQKASQKVGFGVGSYTHGATVVDFAYMGGVYSPTQSRIYLAPYSQGPQANWHYIDCSTGDVVEYPNGLAPAIQNSAYIGGAYSPTQTESTFPRTDKPTKPTGITSTAALEM